MANERTTVVGVFRDRDVAERAIDELHRLGFDDDQIGFATRDGTRTGDSGADGGHKTEEAGSGALSGAIAGAGIGGFIAAAASLLIPGFGPVIAGGILATVLGGAAVGAAAGGVLGALVGLGVPEDEARYYEGEFNEGRMIVTVKAGNRYDEARQVLMRHGAYDIENRQGMTGDLPATGARADHGRDVNRERGVNPDRDVDRERMELREERIQPRTESVQTGEVTVGKDIVTERQEIDVPVRREEVTIERHPVQGRPATGGTINEGEEIRVPIHEERADVDKQAVVYEEVEIKKQQVQDTQHVSADVRREEAVVGGDVRGWDDVKPAYRESWQSRHGSQGGRWEDFEPAYRYGHEMSGDQRFQGRDWSQVEPDLRRDYGAWSQRSGYRHDDTMWDRHRDSIRESWESSHNRRRAA